VRQTEAERAENREAFAKMNLPQRLDHIFEYYKFPLALALIAAVALGSILYYRLTRREALLFVACAAGLALQFGLYVWRQGRVVTTYAVFYEKLVAQLEAQAAQQQSET
jgi:hypothetical protein